MEPRLDPEKLHRFFIALVPPQAIQDYANEVRQYFWDHYNSRKAFNSPPHITLQPPFKWPRGDDSRLKDAIATFATQQSSFGVMLNGFSAFPPRVIYIDVVKSPELMTLQANLMNFMATQLGVVDNQSRQRAYKPHMTVAFRDLKPAAFRKAWPEFQDKKIQFEFAAKAVMLLRHNGQRWEAHQQFALKA